MCSTRWCARCNSRRREPAINRYWLPSTRLIAPPASSPAGVDDGWLRVVHSTPFRRGAHVRSQGYSGEFSNRSQKYSSNCRGYSCRQVRLQGCRRREERGRDTCAHRALDRLADSSARAAHLVDRFLRSLLRAHPRLPQRRRRCRQRNRLSKRSRGMARSSRRPPRR